MKPRHKRFAWIGAGVVALGVAAALVLNAFQSNLVFFFTPTQVAEREAPQGRPFRIGGLVESGSLVRERDSLTVRFRVTDTAKTIPVVYTGLLPDLFKEGKGVVAQGTLGADGTLLYANRRFAELLATPLEKVVGASLSALVPEEDRARFSESRQSLERLDVATGVRLMNDGDLFGSLLWFVEAHLQAAK